MGLIRREQKRKRQLTDRPDRLESRLSLSPSPAAPASKNSRAQVDLALNLVIDWFWNCFVWPRWHTQSVEIAQQ